MSLDQMLSLGKCNSGDEIEVAFRCKANETGRLKSPPLCWTNPYSKRASISYSNPPWKSSL